MIHDLSEKYNLDSFYKLYFLTASGKPYYKQLKKNPAIALVGVDKNYVTVRVRGRIEFVDNIYLEKIFEANPVLDEIYPEDTKDILEVFCLPSGVEEMLIYPAFLRKVKDSPSEGQK